MQGLAEMNENPVRLVPEMASLRLLVLDFVRGYIGRWGASPSYGEIAHALGTNRKRVFKAVKSLSADGALLRVPGPRGLSLPEAEDAALRQLRSLGWSIDRAGRRISRGGVTTRALPAVAVLDYDPGHDESGDDRQGSGRAAAENH